MADEDYPPQIQREPLGECPQVIGAAGNVAKGSGPPPAFIAYAPILKRPSGDAGACQCSAQVRDMTQIILGPPAPAVNDYSHGMGTWPVWQAQVAEIEWIIPV